MDGDDHQIAEVALHAAEANALTAAYLQQLTPLEQTVLKIAQSHLESSFSLEHSLGYMAWLHQRQLALQNAKGT